MLPVADKWWSQNILFCAETNQAKLTIRFVICLSFCEQKSSQSILIFWQHRWWLSLLQLKVWVWSSDLENYEMISIKVAFNYFFGHCYLLITLTQWAWVIILVFRESKWSGPLLCQSCLLPTYMKCKKYYTSVNLLFPTAIMAPSSEWLLTYRATGVAVSAVGQQYSAVSTSQIFMDH